MISVKNLKKNFGKLEVLKSIDVNLEKGKIHAIIGPNGSGKTTLIKSILGLVIPNSGEIRVDGVVVNNKWSYREKIGYMPQIARFPENLEVSELIDMIKDIRKKPAVTEDFIREFKLEPFLNKKLKNLSGGTRQKVNALLALMFDTPIIIFDEPTAALDPVSRMKLKEWILREKAKGKTILLTTHIMSQVEELSDDVVLLIEGNIYFHGQLTELRQSHNGSNLETAIAKIMIETEKLKQ